jgi:hypothetical protein
MFRSILGILRGKNVYIRAFVPSRMDKLFPCGCLKDCPQHVGTTFDTVVLYLLLYTAYVGISNGSLLCPVGDRKLR